MEMADWWVWNLRSSKQYTVKSAYGNLTSIDLDFNVGFKYVLWLKMVPLKFNIFVYSLMLNKLSLG